jgi:hypothetical protein
MKSIITETNKLMSSVSRMKCQFEELIS